MRGTYCADAVRDSIPAEDLPRLAGIQRGAIVQVSGETASVNGKRQLKVAGLRVLPAESVDRRDLLPSVNAVEPYWETLDRWRRDIRGPRLRRTVDLSYADPDFRARYEACPASTSGHHAELGGLLRHTCEVAAIGRAIARTCGADTDLIVAGALLHDVGKLEAYRWDRAFEMTDAGALLGHVALGLLMLDRRVHATVPPPCTEQERLILLQLVGSHHGRQEYGATTPPITLEAEVLHFADNASAKTASMSEVLLDPSTSRATRFFPRARSGRLIAAAPTVAGATGERANRNSACLRAATRGSALPGGLKSAAHFPGGTKTERPPSRG